MGPDTNQPLCTYFFLDGESLPLNIGEITAPFACECDAPPVLELRKPLTFTMRLSKGFRCGNRKRFVKLLMSRGFSRNKARRLASYVSAGRGWLSYHSAFFWVCTESFQADVQEDVFMWTKKELEEIQE